MTVETQRPPSRDHGTSEEEWRPALSLWGAVGSGLLMLGLYAVVFLIVGAVVEG